MKLIIQIYRPKILILCMSMALVLSVSLKAQAPAIEWRNALGGTGNEGGNSIRQTSDGGYVVAGYSFSNNGDVSGNHGLNDFWVAKLNAAGILQWQNSLGGGGNDSCEDIRQTADGGFILIGFSNANGGDVTGNHGGLDVWVVRLNGSGNIIWQKSLGGSNLDRGYSIHQTNDGGFVFAGSSRSSDGDVSTNQGLDDFWVVKLNSVGNILWQRSYGGSGSDVLKSIQQTSDGGFVVVGQTTSNDGQVVGQHGLNDFWVAKLNATGILLWQNTLGGSNDDMGRGIQETLDNGFIVSGQSNSNDGDVSGNNGNFDFWLIKLNSVGSFVGQVSLGGSDIDGAYDVRETSDGAFVVLGQSRSNNGDVTGNHGNEDFWIVRTNASGQLQWQRSLGGSQGDEGISLELTQDGGFIMAGYTASNDGDVSGNHGQDDFWVVKLAPDPLLVSEFEVNTYRLYPNPVTNILHIEATESIEKIVIFDMLGQKLLERSPSMLKAEIDMESFSEGTYIIQIIANHKTDSFKIIKH